MTVAKSCYICASLQLLWHLRIVARRNKITHRYRSFNAALRSYNLVNLVLGTLHWFRLLGILLVISVKSLLACRRTSSAAPLALLGLKEHGTE